MSYIGLVILLVVFGAIAFATSDMPNAVPIAIALAIVGGGLGFLVGKKL